MIATSEQTSFVPNQNSIKRQKLLAAIPTSKTLMEAGIKAGYSPGARNIYRKNTLKHIGLVIHSDPEAIKKRFEDLGNIAQRKGDLTNALRANESLARINAMFTDNIKQETQLTDEQKRLVLDRLKQFIVMAHKNGSIGNGNVDANCKPSSEPMVDNSNAQCKPANDAKVYNDTNAQPVENGQGCAPSTVQDNPSHKQGIAMDTGGGGVEGERVKTPNPPSEFSQHSKVASSASGKPQPSPLSFKELKDEELMKLRQRISQALSDRRRLKRAKKIREDMANAS